MSQSPRMKDFGLTKDQPVLWPANIKLPPLSKMFGRSFQVHAMSKRTILASAALSLALLAGTASANAADKLRILGATWIGYAPVFVAEDLGYFQKLGLDVDLKFEDERSNVLAAMARGDIDMNMETISEYQGRPRTADTPSVIIGTIDGSFGADAVIADGSIKSVADLKGKTVASQSNIPARLLLQMELKKAGLSFKDITMKEVALGDTVAVFADPSIAAVVSGEPFISQAIKSVASRNPWVIVSSREYPGFVTDVYVVPKDELKSDPDKYRRFMIGVLKAIEYYKTNKADFEKLAAPHYNLSAEDFSAGTIGVRYMDLAETQSLMGSSDHDGKIKQIFDTLMDLNVENGAADAKLDADKSINTSVAKTLTSADLN